MITAAHANIAAKLSNTQISDREIDIISNLIDERSTQGDFQASYTSDYRLSDDVVAIIIDKLKENEFSVKYSRNTLRKVTFVIGW